MATIVARYLPGFSGLPLTLPENGVDCLPDCFWAPGVRHLVNLAFLPFFRFRSITIVTFAGSESV